MRQFPLQGRLFQSCFLQKSKILFNPLISAMPKSVSAAACCAAKYRQYNKKSPIGRKDLSGSTTNMGKFGRKPYLASFPLQRAVDYCAFSVKNAVLSALYSSAIPNITKKPEREFSHSGLIALLAVCYFFPPSICAFIARNISSSALRLATSVIKSFLLDFGAAIPIRSKILTGSLSVAKLPFSL